MRSVGAFLVRHWSFRWAERVREHRNWGWLWIVLYVTLFKLGLGAIIIAFFKILGHDPGLTALAPLLVAWFALYQPAFNHFVAKKD